MTWLLASFQSLYIAWTCWFFIRSGSVSSSTCIDVGWLARPVRLRVGSNWKSKSIVGNVDITKLERKFPCLREVLTLPYMATRAISQLILSVSSHTIISMLTCRCSWCYPSQKYETIATIKKHLRKDLELVDNSRIREHSAEFLAHLQECIDNNTRYLQSLGEWN